MSLFVTYFQEKTMAAMGHWRDGILFFATFSRKDLSFVLYML